MKTKYITFVKATIMAYIITIILLALIALLLYKSDSCKEYVNWMMDAVYVLANFTGGFICAKVIGHKKILCGIAAALVYLVILGAVSLALSGGIMNELPQNANIVFLCICGGVIGAVFS